LNRNLDEYYDSLAPGYEALHSDEQREKIRLALEFLRSDPEIDLNSKLMLFDVGCGTGISTTLITSFCAGLDPAIELLGIANKKRLNLSSQSSNTASSSHQNTNANHLGYIRGIAELLPVRNKACDIVFCITSVHNFKDITEGISELRRIARARSVITVLKKSEKFGLIIEIIKNNFQVLKTTENNYDCFFYLKPKDKIL
jgi:ubiquinone/menaquinone biosynthesis C-methylase UbiE